MNEISHAGRMETIACNEKCAVTVCAAFLLARSLRAYPVVRDGCLPQAIKFGHKVHGVHREVCHIYAFLKVLTLLAGGIRTACTIDKSNCHYNGKEKPQYVFHASRCKVLLPRQKYEYFSLCQASWARIWEEKCACAMRRCQPCHIWTKNWALARGN